MGLLLSDEEIEDYYKMLVYGKPGTGKTTLGVTAPKPLFLLSERQGYRSVKDAARRLGIPTPPSIWVETLEDVRNVLRALYHEHDEPIAVALRQVLGASDETEEKIARLPYLRPETIVTDSVTDFFTLIGQDIERTTGKIIGKDGLEVKHDRYWGVLRDRSEALIRSFRDLPYHILFLALLSDREVGEGDEKSREVQPACAMKALPSALVAAVNLCGIMSVREVASQDEEGELTYQHQRWVRFAGPGWMTTKMMRPLRDVEVPHVGAWFDTLRNNTVTEPLDLGGYDPHADENLNQGSDDAAA